MNGAQHFSNVLPMNNGLQFIIFLFLLVYLPYTQAIIAHDDSVTTSPNMPVTIPILANDIDNHFIIVLATGDAFNQVCSPNEDHELECQPLGFASNSSYQVALADINQDGLLDVVLANYDLPNQICLATSNDFLCRQIGAQAFHSMDVALADFNGDQMLDAIFANRDNRNSVCLGDGQGEFECQMLNDLPARSFGVTVDDFNQDGYLDVIFATFFQNDKVCLGDGQGGFECSALRLYATSSVAVASGDLNNDQRIDAVFSTITGSTQICLNEGQAVFNCSDMTSEDKMLAEEFQSNNLALADINDDNQLDAIFAVPGEPNRLCLGNGSGQFSCETLPGVFWSYGVAVGYVNEDKILDIVFANDGDPNRLCFGQGKGQFVCQTLNADRMFTTDVALGFLGFDLSRLRIVEPPVHGRASIDSEGNLIYTPKFSFSGRDTLSYQINEAKALVTITIEPQIKFSSEPPPHRLLYFGKTLVAQPLSLSLNVHNQGNLPVVIDSATFSGDQAEAFKWVSPQLPFTVEERSAEFTLQCAPTDTGIKTATLTLHTNDPQQPTPSYPLRCSAHLTPEAGYFSQPSLNNNTLDFGQTLVNTTTTAELIFIEKGNAPLVIELIELSGNHPEIFQLLDAHWPLTITEGGAAQTLTIQCIPTQLGIQTALLKLSTNDPQYPSPVYLLSCGGHNEPQAVYSSQPPVNTVLDFGKTQIATPISLTFDIIEQGNIALEIEFSEIQGPHAEDFEWITPELPIILADGEPPIQVMLQCTPSATGLRTATLVLHSTDPQKPIINYPLTCSGHNQPQAGYASQPAVETQLNLGSSTLNQSVTTTLTLIEKGNQALEVNFSAIEGEHAEDFEVISPDTWPLIVDAQTPEQEIVIQCTPSAVGKRSATLILSSNDVALPKPHYPLTCSGQAPTDIQAHYVSTPPPQTPLTFGETPLATTITTTLIITNTSSLPLTIDSEEFIGEHAAEFQIVDSQLPLTLSPEQEVSITLQCQPAEAGIRRATLILTTTATDQASARYPLTCQGQAVASTIPKQPTVTYQPGELLVKLNQTEAFTDDVELTALMEEFKVKEVSPVLTEAQPFYLLTLPVDADIPKAATHFSATLAVDYAEPNYILTPSTLPNDPYQYPATVDNLQRAWTLTTGDSEVVLAIVDTGIDYFHEDLSDKIIKGYDFVAQDDNAQDDHGHGTVLAGLAAARTDNHLGIAGVCWHCQLMAVKVADHQGDATVARLIQGIEYAIAQGADIILIGLGSPHYARTLHEFIEAHAVIPIVAATGNQGSSVIDYPAKLPQTIAVGALDAQGNKWANSNSGQQLDIVAPGVQLTSTGLNNSYPANLAGTCLAAAQVTGALGLLLSLCPELTAAKLRTLLTETAHDLGVAGWDADYGHGQLDVAALLAEAKANNCFQQPLPCAQAPTLTSTTNGQWQDPATWTPQRQPQREDIILIRPQHTVMAQPQALHFKGLCNHGQLQGLPKQTLMLITAGEKGFIDNYGQIQAAAGGQTQNCADSGSDVLLKVAAGRIHNYPQSVMASGGSRNGSELACSPAEGGQLSLLAQEIINEGQLVAGGGSDIATEIFTSQGGQGGNIYLKGSFKAPGHITQTATGSLQAGVGGQGYYGGQGGRVQLKVLPQLTLQGQCFSGAGGQGVIQGRYGKIIIDPTQLTFKPGVEIKGGEVMAFCTPPCTLDLSQLQSGAIVAHENLILAGEQLDLRHSAPQALSTMQQAQLFVTHIKAEQKLTEIIEAQAGVQQYGVQTFAAVTLIAPRQLQATSGQTLTIPLILINESAQAQRYQLTATDTAGWPLSPLPTSIFVPAQGVRDETVQLTLPTTPSVDNVITLTATAHNEPQLLTTTTIEISRSTETATTPIMQHAINTLLSQPIDSQLPLCPQTGYIDEFCRNEAQVMTDVVLGPHASVAGGRLAGHIDNQGLVAQVIIEPGAYFQGGKVTGYVVNQGTMADFEFVGADVSGGLLGGQIVNNSRIGGTLTDVCLAANAHITGGHIQGNIRNQEQAQPARLSHLVVKLGSQLSPLLELDPQTVQLAEGIEWLSPPQDHCEQFR